MKSEHHHQSGGDEADQWQYELDLFVDGFLISASKKANDKRNMYFEIVEGGTAVDDPSQRIRMPIIVNHHPWLRSKAMRNTIIEVFAQAFRFGASWENARD